MDVDCAVVFCAGKAPKPSRAQSDLAAISDSREWGHLGKARADQGGRGEQTGLYASLRDMPADVSIVFGLNQL